MFVLEYVVSLLLLFIMFIVFVFVTSLLASFLFPSNFELGLRLER